MPQFKLSGFGQEEVNAEGGSFKVYEGPLPPKNKRTRVKIRNLKIKINSSNNPMFTCIAEVDNPKGHPYAQYNGAVMFWNGNLTKQGAGYVNEFLQAVAGSATLGKKLAQAVWTGAHGGMNLADKAPTKDGTVVNAIGTIKFSADKDRYAEVVTAHSKVNKGPRKGDIDLAVGSWVLPKAVEKTPDEEDEDEVAEDEAAEDGVEVEDDEDSEDAEEDEEDEESEDDSEEDEEEGEEEYSKEPPF